MATSAESGLVCGLPVLWMIQPHRVSMVLKLGVSVEIWVNDMCKHQSRFVLVPLGDGSEALDTKFGSQQKSDSAHTANAICCLCIWSSIAWILVFMQCMVQNLCTAEWTAEVPKQGNVTLPRIEYYLMKPSQKWWCVSGGYIVQYSSTVTLQEHFIWRTAFAGVPQNKEVMYPVDTEQIFE